MGQYFGQNEGGRAAVNVTEAWAIYDTIQIGQHIKEASNLGFPSYAMFAGKQKHSFFNVRNVGETGLAYTNLETKDQMPYAFDVSSIGVRFSAPGSIIEPSVGEFGLHNMAVHALFVQEVPNHVGLRFKVSQDEKLLHTCYLAPEGSGPFGQAGIISQVGTAGAIAEAGITSMSQGYPALENRFRFPDSIGIPRGATFTVELELSEYVARLIKAFPGPGYYTFQAGEGGTWVESCALVRVSLFGRRYVQQRGEIHR